MYRGVSLYSKYIISDISRISSHFWIGHLDEALKLVFLSQDLEYPLSCDPRPGLEPAS